MSSITTPDEKLNIQAVKDAHIYYVVVDKAAAYKHLRTNFIRPWMESLPVNNDDTADFFNATAEAVQNAIRHGSNLWDTVEISLSYTPPILIAKVKDSGDGFDMNVCKRKYRGLDIMTRSAGIAVECMGSGCLVVIVKHVEAEGC